MSHPDHPNYPEIIQGDAGIAVVEAVLLHDDGQVIFIVFFRGHSKAFRSETDALAFAEHVAEHGWTDAWQTSNAP